jgi:hypothetical protein
MLPVSVDCPMLPVSVDCPMLPVSVDCLILIVPSVFSNVYLSYVPNVTSVRGLSNLVTLDNPRTLVTLGTQDK